MIGLRHIAARMVPVCFALLVGSLVSAAVFAAAMAAGSGKVLGPLVMFGTPTAYLIDSITPPAFWYWIDPDGGAAMGLLLFTVSAWLQLSVVAGGVIYVLWRWRTRLLALRSGNV